MKQFFAVILITTFYSCKKAHEYILYQSSSFTLYKDKVVQGNNTATVLSPTHIVSHYHSPASTTYPRLIKFKFSINEKDNEMAPGVDHWVLIGNEHVSPLFTFGQASSPAPDNAEGYLPVNYTYTFQVDMRPVLRQFEEKGYFEAYDGSRVAKTDFKGFYIAGASEPLSWDFVNLEEKGLKLKDPDKDGIYTITLKLNPYNETAHSAKEWKLSLDISGKPSYRSDQPIVDALYHLSLEEALKNIEPDSTFRTGAQWGGVWTRDISYSILLAFAYLQPDIAKISLMKKVKRNRIIQDTGSGGAWPVSSDRTTWVLAAWEIYKATGDKDWLQRCFSIIQNTLEDDVLVLLNHGTELYRGESSFLDWREQTYPKWMNNVDIYASQNLGTNVVHYQANRILAMMAVELKQPSQLYEARAAALKEAINHHLWMEDKGYYAQYLYGRMHFLRSPRFEALGEALAILFDVADAKQAASIMECSPLTEFGTTCIYPQIPGIPPYHNNAIWPFVQSYWNLAAAKVGNEAALSHGLAAIYRAAAFFLSNYENMVATTGDFKGTEINSSRMLWSMAGNLAMVHRVFMGMHFETEGIRFKPAIPAAYKGKKTLRNFRYRKALLNITVNGTGNTLRSIRMDGNPLPDAFLPANLTGKHDIEMEMDNKPMTFQRIHLVANRFSPATPRVIFKDRMLSWTPVKDASAYQVYRNGKAIASVKDSFYRLTSPQAAEYAVAAIDAQGISSFISEPIFTVSDAAIMHIQMEDVAGKAAYPFLNYRGTGFTEISTRHNQRIVIPVNIPTDGNYRIDFRYANGSGPWNTDNKCAIRSLYVENKYIGSMVFPQRGTDEWSDWGYSNGYSVALKKGIHHFSLVLEPWNTNMNVEVNRAMLDYMRIIPL